MDMPWFDWEAPWADGNKKFIVVARDRNNHAAEMPSEIDDEDRTFYEEPMDKESWVHEHGMHLDPGVTYYCVQTTDRGYDFQDPEWTHEEAGGDEDAPDPDEVAERAAEKVADDMATAASEVNLADVRDTEELEAKVRGIAVQEGIQKHADGIDDILRILDATSTSNPDNPLGSLLSGVDNRLKVDNMTDLGVLMMLPELQRVMDEGMDAVENFNSLMSAGGDAGGGLAGAFGSGGDSGGSDTVEITRAEYERLAGGGGGGTADQPPATGGSSTATGGGGDDSFSMDDLTDAPDDDDDTTDGMETDADDSGTDDAATATAEAEFEVEEDSETDETPDDDTNADEVTA